MLRQAPPLEAAEAFLLAAQARSFRAAAASIALSPSAFSRRIQALEAFVGVALFDRSGPVPRLTEAGALYLAEVGPALETVRRATTAFRERAQRRRLRIATSHSLAAEWLMPRLGQLLRDRGIEVELIVSRDLRILQSGAADLAIWGGYDPGSAVIREQIVALDGVLVSAPCLADGRDPPQHLARLADYRVLALKSPGNLWHTWLAAAGHSGAAPTMIETYETNQLMYEAAANGFGVTLAVPLITERFLQDGRLTACTLARASTEHDYSLFHVNPDIRQRPVARDFVEWLRAEALESRRGFDRWYAAQEDKQTARLY